MKVKFHYLLKSSIHADTKKTNKQGWGTVMTTATAYVNSIESAIQNLRYIQNELLKGNYAKNGAMLEYALEEATEAIKGNGFSYKMQYMHSNLLQHHVTYISFAKRFRAKVLSLLEELAINFRSKKCNEKRCLVIVAELIESNLYRDKVQKQINKYRNLSGITQIKTVGIQ